VFPALEAHRFVTTQTLLDDLVKPLESSTADEQDVGSVDLDEILVRMLAPTLGWHVGNGALDDLEQRLLHALAGDITRDRWVVGLARDFVYFVDVDDTAFGTGNIKIGGLDQAQQDVFDILSNIARFRKSSGIRDTKWHVKNFGERLRQQCLTASGRTDQKDVALAQFHIVDLHAHANTLVMVVYCHCQRLFGAFLPDHILAELLENLLGSRYFARLQARLRNGRLFFLDDLSTQINALITDVDTAGTGDESLHLILTLTAE